MAQVSDKVLSWLYSVLQEYQDPQRTYSDTARTLSVFHSLSPRTEVYTNEHGRSALLLSLTGTLPVEFRGATYRFPVKLWMPRAYPQEPPIPFVMPGRDMVIRPGQHVAVEGRVFHPYLRDWPSMWDRASTVEFLEYLQQVFAKEPPVISKAQQQQYQRPIGQPPQHPGASPAPPPPPPKRMEGDALASQCSNGGGPPPRPPKPGGTPKPGEEYADPSPQRAVSRDISRDGPPLPPLPHERPQSGQYVPSPQPQNGYGAAPRPVSQLPHPPHNGEWYNGEWYSGSDYYSPRQHPPQRQASVAQNSVSPMSPVNGYSRPPDTRYSQPPPLPQAPLRQQLQQQPQQQSFQQQQPGQAYPQYQTHQRPPYQQPQQPQPQPQSWPQNQPYTHPQPHQPAPTPKQPPPDLLSDPFEVTLPPQPHQHPHTAPPIPPNPEKEHLLAALSTALTTAAHARIAQNLAALPPLHAQHRALQAAHARLHAETTQLNHLTSALASNETLLQRTIQACDATSANASSKPSPDVDALLVPPNLVAAQLWTLLSEVAAVEEAMVVLQRGVVKGRVGGEVFVRLMRALGRERFLKGVLVKKCAAGLGLVG